MDNHSFLKKVTILGENINVFYNNNILKCRVEFKSDEINEDIYGLLSFIFSAGRIDIKYIEYDKLCNNNEFIECTVKMNNQNPIKIAYCPFYISNENIIYPMNLTYNRAILDENLNSDCKFVIIANKNKHNKFCSLINVL
jgi:hypothetical protein